MKNIPQWCVFINGRLVKPFGNHIQSYYNAWKARQCYIHDKGYADSEVTLKIALAKIETK